MKHQFGIRWTRPALLLIAIVAFSGFVDILPSDGGASTGVANLTAFLLAHILTQGISKVLVFALVLVGLPWMVAGAALTASLVSFRR